MNPSIPTTTDWRDARWQEDYQQALGELGFPQHLLPVLEVAFQEVPQFTPQTMHQYNVPAVEHAFDPDCREDVLALVRIVKTPKPGLRTVFYDGVLIGKIGRNPWGVGWVASCSRGRLYWSAADAALALVEEMTP